MKKLTNSDDSAITDAPAGMAAVPTSRVAGVERPDLTRPKDALMNTPALRWER